MTIATETRRAGPYSGNGSTQVFAFSFKCYAAADLVVVTTTSGVDTVKTLTTHYTVSLNANQNTNPGGSITMLTAPATGTTLVITTDQSYLQETSFVNAGAWLPEAVNDALDKQTIMHQQNRYDIERSIRGAISDSAWDRLPTASERADGLLGFDATGQPEIVDIGSVEGMIAGIATVAGIAAEIEIVAAADVDIATVADNIDEVETVATAIENGTLIQFTGIVTGDSATETDAALTVTRTFTGTAAERIATLTLRNTGDAVGGQDYQNEVHLRMQAGTSATHRRYIDFIKFNGQPDYVMGSNAGGTFILFDEDANVHRLWIENGNTLSGDTMINAAGASGKVRIGYHAADTLPPTAFNFYVGGAPASNFLAFSFDVANGAFRKYLHTDGTTQQVIIDADGDVGIGKANPSFKLDIETTGNAPFRMVWATGTFSQNAHSATWTTTTTNASDMLTMTDGDNSASRAVLNLKGNAGAQEVLYAASNGNVGIRTGASPTAALDINSDILRLRTAKTPASATAAGNAGDFCWDASYFYICTATNTWRRVAHATW